MQALFADISHFQPAQIGGSYWPWTRAGDGAARLVCKASEGVGYKDANFESYWHQAMVAQAGMVGVYHYARADLNPGPAGAAKEAQWFAQVVNKRLFPEDRLMLDFEEQESAAWAHAFHDALQAAYPRNVKPVLYDSMSHFTRFFAGDLALAAKFDCALAAYHPRVQGPPPAPPGWNMLWWQYSSTEGIPGIGTAVDANVWLGGRQMIIPIGWTDDGTALHNPVNAFVVAGTFRQYVLGILSSTVWNPVNVPLEDQHAQSPLEISNPPLGAGQQQVFRLSVLEESPAFNSGKPFESWVGQELLVLRAQIANPPPPQPSKADIALAALKAAWE